MSSSPRGNRLALVLAGTALAVSLGANGVPALASALVDNSDKVDGLHAVHYGATVDQRKGKLVATNGQTGRLPNDIIAKAPDSKRLGGLPASDYETTADSAQTYLTQANAAASYLTIASAASSYLGIADAASTYLTKASAANNYLLKTTADSDYLKKADAATTYWAKASTGALRGDYLLATDGRPSSFTFPTSAQSGMVVTQTFHLPRAGHLFVQMSETLTFSCATAGDYGLEWLRVDATTDHAVDVRSSAVSLVSDGSGSPYRTVTLSGLTDASLPAGDHTVTVMVGCSSSNFAGLSWFLAAPSAYAVVVPNSFVTPSLVKAPAHSTPQVAHSGRR